MSWIGGDDKVQHGQFDASFQALDVPLKSRCFGEGHGYSILDMHILWASMSPLTQGAFISLLGLSQEKCRSLVQYDHKCKSVYHGRSNSLATDI